MELVKFPFLCNKLQAGVNFWYRDIDSSLGNDDFSPLFLCCCDPAPSAVLKASLGVTEVPQVDSDLGCEMLSYRFQQQNLDICYKIQITYSSIHLLISPQFNLQLSSVGNPHFFFVLQMKN